MAARDLGPRGASGKITVRKKPWRGPSSRATRRADSSFAEHDVNYFQHGVEKVCAPHLPIRFEARAGHRLKLSRRDLAQLCGKGLQHAAIKRELHITAQRGGYLRTDNQRLPSAVNLAAS